LTWFVNLKDGPIASQSVETNMPKTQWTRVAVSLLTACSLTGALQAGIKPQKATKEQREARAEQNLAREVRHQLVLLPYYSVFDNLAYRVQGDEVTLEGQVTRPTLKSDAGNVVKSIEGVRSVTNNIEVLPLSPMDDQLRRALYRAIYGEPQLSKYSWSAVASIHIIVKNGHVTLVGVVDNETDKNLAGIRANGVPNVFSVTNNLQVVENTK
jgi:hyperosmotically inducible periplasmic protein